VVSPEIVIVEVAVAVGATEEEIEEDTEEIVEIDGTIGEVVVVGEEDLEVEAVTEDVDVDLHLIVQCQEADHVPRVLHEEDVVVEGHDLVPDQNNVTTKRHRYERT